MLTTLLVLLLHLLATPSLAFVLQEGGCKEKCDEKRKESSGQDPNLTEYQRRYEGKCKDRCEKGRAGGFHDFRLNCTSRYTTKQEKDLCLRDCNSECSEDICYKNDTISCKEDKREAMRIEKEKEEIKSLVAKEYNEKIGAINNSHRTTMITLSVLLVIVILATTVFVWLTLRKKRVAPEVVNGRTMSMQETRTFRDLSTSDIDSSSESRERNVQSK